MMTMCISEVLEAVRTSIASSTGLEVNLGVPVDSGSGLSIFAFRFSEESGFRSISARATIGQTERRLLVHCLLMPSTSDALRDFGKGLNSLHEKPVIGLGRKQVRVTFTNLSIEELAALFLSAGITYRIAASFQLDWND